MSGLWRLRVREEFSAGHYLRDYGGKCENPHGHNFGVEISVRGRKLAHGAEILLDFKILKQALREILAELDHRVLNDAPPFDRINPSSENIARHIYQRMKAFLDACPEARAAEASMESASVAEKESQSATYMEDGQFDNMR